MKVETAVFKGKWISLGIHAAKFKFLYLVENVVVLVHQVGCPSDICLAPAFCAALFPFPRPKSLIKCRPSARIFDSQLCVRLVVPAARPRSPRQCKPDRHHSIFMW